MDGVRPVAVAAREQRREARKVIDSIDALLRSLEDGEDGGGDAERRPAPAVGFGRSLGSCSVAAAASRRVRANVTPGPGAYAVETASVKPRVLAAAFRAGGCSCRLESCSCSTDKRRHQRVQDEPLAPPSRADAALKADIKVAVQYRARATPNFRTFEQKQRVRVVLAARQRWRRVGFHSVNHQLVERRVDVGHVAFNVATCGEKREQARLRRKLRAWKHTAAPSRPQNDATASKSKFDGDDKAQVTAQWKRARASRLLQESERRKNAQLTPSTDARSMSRGLRPLPAHDMKRQSGRDNVHCRSKHLKAVLRFCDDVLKEHPCPPSGGDMQATRTSESKSQRAPFSVAVGRDGARFDQASGLYLVVKDSPRSLILAPTDANTRPRARACVMFASSREDPHKTNAANSLAYSPKFALVDRTTRGHRFVTFKSQRPRSAAPRGDDREQVILTPDLAKVYDQQAFPRAARVVDYHKMLGRFDQ